MTGKQSSPGSEPMEPPHETPVDVQNLASYFDKMQVGKKTGASAMPSRTGGQSSGVAGASASGVNNTIGSSE